MSSSLRYCNLHCVFSTPGLKSHDVFINCQAVCKALLNEQSPKRWAPVAFNCLKFCIPTDDSVPWIFRKNNSADSDAAGASNPDGQSGGGSSGKKRKQSGTDVVVGKLQLLFTSMEASAQFQPSKRPKEDVDAANITDVSWLRSLFFFICFSRVRVNELRSLTF